jgi:DNA-binding SARP family transcriptional activator
MGNFDTWRGPDLIPNNGWQRSKSRQLFQLFTTFYDQPLEREQIFEYLWPGVSLEASERNFKVALSSLYRVLEPDRKAGCESAYIIRDDSRYTLRQEADLWLDMEVFLTLLKEADSVMVQFPQQAVMILEKAVALYQGEYLPCTRYETWAAARREQLLVAYLQAADHLCEYYLKGHNPEQVIQLSQQILSEDNCWERAYRHLMAAYDQLGDHGQVARTYRRCVEILQEELDISPSPETSTSYRDLVGQDN